MSDEHPHGLAAFFSVSMALLSNCFGHNCGEKPVITRN